MTLGCFRDETFQSDNEGIDVIFGYCMVPEIYFEVKRIPLTKKQKIEIITSKAKDMAWEIFLASLLAIGLLLQVAGLAYIGGILFKQGML